MQRTNARALLVAAASALSISVGHVTAGPAGLGDLPLVIERAAIPGMSLALVEDGIVTEQLALGFKDATTKHPVTESTVFEAASLTKPVFAYGVLMLTERGKLDLDRPLTEYLAFVDVENDDRVNQITARIVLSHTTGLPNWRRDNPLTIGPDPGTTFGYSGEGYVFLQRVVEKITGQTMDEFLTATLFDPLEMNSTFVAWHDEMTVRVATGHDYLERPKEKWQPEANAAGSLHTTAGDYARFLAEVMHPTLLKRSTVNEMLTPKSEAAEGVTWGLGWGLEEATLSDGSTDRMFWHWGNNGWFKCFTISSPQQDVGLVYFTNSENGLSICDYIVTSVFAGTHPALAWRSFTTSDSPAFAIRLKLAGAAMSGGADALRAEYDRLAQTYAPESFDENMMNNLGYGLLGDEVTEAAVVVFRLNAAAYPESWNVYDSLGEGLAALGETEAAIRSYERSVELNPENTNGEAMLEQLRAQLASPSE